MRKLYLTPKDKQGMPLHQNHVEQRLQSCPPTRLVLSRIELNITQLSIIILYAPPPPILSPPFSHTHNLSTEYTIHFPSRFSCSDFRQCYPKTSQVWSGRGNSHQTESPESFLPTPLPLEQILPPARCVDGAEVAVTFACNKPRATTLPSSYVSHSFRVVVCRSMRGY